MKNGEIFRAKQEAYNTIQKIQDPTQRYTVFIILEMNLTSRLNNN